MTREQLFLQLGLPLKHAEPVLHSPVVLTQGPKTTRKHLFLFRDWLVIAKQRCLEISKNSKPTWHPSPGSQPGMCCFQRPEKTPGRHKQQLGKSCHGSERTLVTGSAGAQLSS
ncbi:uncharacterized protein LOC116533427 [Sapajus apella]|uniref:Uncharacterized protein LOC116533427 n=1 Tax=Sapajus apella TaxID=9515 RepID=A0A6J3FTX0_SAPAP|nr:uncharacterized protein LOC116533427 [Sapajus apella]